MDKRNYKPRIIDRQVEEYLSAFGAVCVEGPKWCGKTWTSSYHSRSEIYIGDPAGNFQNRRLAELAPALVLEGETPRLIDEWQEAPPLWDAVRYQVDQTARRGQFILTGSATPNHKGILHSGAGRIARLRMRPMSLWESGDSSGRVSLEKLCHGELTPAMTGEVDLKTLIALIIRGGWPGSLGLPLEQAALLPTEYLNAVIDDDVYRIDGVKRDTQKMRLLLRSLARNESTTVTNKTLIKTLMRDGQRSIPKAGRGVCGICDGAEKLRWARPLFHSRYFAVWIVWGAGGRAACAWLRTHTPRIKKGMGDCWNSNPPYLFNE